jgi:hypothetical protein
LNLSLTLHEWLQFLGDIVSPSSSSSYCTFFSVY